LQCITYLLVTNGEFALGLLIGIGESLELLDRLRLRDFNSKFDVALGILVARLDGRSTASAFSSIAWNESNPGKLT